VYAIPVPSQQHQNPDEHHRPLPGGNNSVARLNSRDFRSRKNFQFQNRSRSLTRDHRGDSSRTAPSRKGYEDSHHGSASRGDRFDRWHGDDRYDRYGSDLDRNRYTSERSLKRRDDSSFCAFPRAQSRDRSLSRDEDYSYHNGTRARDGEGESPETSPKPLEDWPPCFEKDGSLFVFDTRSAMFYESLSDFFYDPKSKLYFGNRKGAYFRYDSTKDPPFVEVQKVDDAVASASQVGPHGTMDQIPIQATKTGVQSTESSKPKIAIKLKTKKIKSSCGEKSSISVSESPMPSAMPKAHKEKIANIEKWTEMQAELKQDVVEAGGPGGGNTVVSRPASDVRMTARGEPICVVCRRKFPNIDKLRLHEKASELHKQNLQKLKGKELLEPKRKSPEVAATETAAEYQDRAAKRRQLHGPPMSDVLGLRLAANTTQHHEPSIKGEALDESHLGHKMLQKLGWKGHESEGGTDGRSKSVSDQLRREWDRIESLAGNPNRPATNHSH
jgi:hypothetical protein